MGLYVLYDPRILAILLKGVRDFSDKTRGTPDKVPSPL